MAPKVVGICGYSQSGKDSAFIELTKLLDGPAIRRKFDPFTEFRRVAFADTLKADMNCLVNKCRDVNPVFDPYNNKSDKEIFRPMWVAWGHVARQIHPDFWIERIRPLIEHYIHYERAITGAQQIPVITDVRYANEIQHIIEDWQGVVYYIKRPGVGPENEEETKSFEEIFRRYGDLLDKNTINNDGGKIDLGFRLLEALDFDINF